MNFEFFMKKAIDEAVNAYELKEVPIGAVVVHENRIIGKGYNMTETLNDPTAHAEMIAITAACETMKSKRLKNCQLFVTHEPCAMCAGAIIHARLSQVIYAANEYKFGACGSVVDLFDKQYFNHQVQIIDGVMASDAESLIRLFFQEKRKEKN